MLCSKIDEFSAFVAENTIVNRVFFNVQTSSSQRALGYAAMAITVAVWSGFALSTRWIALSSLTPFDVALIKFGVPLAMFAFWFPRAVREIRSAPWLSSGLVVLGAALVVFGAGLPFLLASALGGKLSSATLVGVLIPGCSPVFVALISHYFLKQELSRRTWISLAAIVCGVLALLATDPLGFRPLAVGILLVASLIWALYTLELKRAKLHPITAILLLCLPALVASAATLFVGWGQSNLSAAPVREILVFVLVQGIGAGAVANLCYSAAIRRIGANVASGLGAMSPVVVMLFAVPLFGESLTVAKAVAILLIVGGIVASNTKTSSAKKTPVAEFEKLQV